MSGGQLGLLLWKNYVVRKRQPVILGLVFLWPIVVFVLLHTIRDNVDTENNPTCQFPARLMPRDGFLPFIQSFVCSIGNPCEPLDNYELVPSYKKAKLGPLMMELQPILYNQTILSAINTLPQGIKFIRSLTETLTKPEIKKLFVTGIRLGDLFSNLEEVKKMLKEQMPEVRENIVDDLFDASLNLDYLVDPLGSANIDKIVFSPASVEQILIVPKEEDLSAVTRVLRSVDNSQIPDILEKLSKHLDLMKIFEIFSCISDTFKNYDFIDDVTKVVVAILDLDTVNEFLPKNLKLRQWIPEILSILKGVRAKRIDSTFISETEEKLSSLFLSKDVDRDWPVNLSNELKNRHVDEIELSTQVFDNLREVFSEKIFNTLTYFISMMKNVVQVAHHVAIIHEELPERLSNITRKHEKIVNRILKNVDPEVYRTVVKSFLRLEIVEELVEVLQEQQIADVICKRKIFNLIFQTDAKKSAVSSYNLICSDDGKQFVTDVYESFEFERFSGVIKNTLSTFRYMNSFQPIPTRESNLTSSIKSLREFLHYLEHHPTTTPKWTHLNLNEKWGDIFEETQTERRKSVLGYHLSIAKLVGFQNLSTIMTKLNLGSMDLIADEILIGLREIPEDWMSQVRQHKSELLESFYSTASDKNKVLKILEYSNFTRSYCVEKDIPELINYPSRSNATLLKGLICRSLRAVQMQLDTNIEKLKYHDTVSKDWESFNWTAFNGKVIDIYAYMDDLVRLRDNEVSYLHQHLDEFKENFTNVWLQDLTPEDSWQISVGLLCKMINLAESPLFDVKYSSIWGNLHALAWSASTISDHIERALDDILKVNSSEKISLILRNMPESKIFLDTIFRDFPAIIQDVADVLVQKVPNHQENGKFWLKNSSRSLGGKNEVFNREVEVNRERNIEPFLAFNWTLGYINFRGLVNKFVIFMDDTAQLDLTGNFIRPEERVHAAMDYIDMIIDENVPVFRGNMTAEKVSMSVGEPRGLDEMLVIGKFGSKFLHDAVHLGLKLLMNDSKNINFLTVLGFTPNSPISIFVKRFPHILATVFHGLSDPHFENRVHKTIERNVITCSDIFDWFLNYKVGINNDEYGTLRNFTCYGDLQNFNAFSDFFLEESIIARTAVSKYGSHFFSSVKDLNDFSETIEDIMDGTLKIVPPLGENYFMQGVKTLKNILDNTKQWKLTTSIRKTESGWSTIRAIIALVSEVLNNAAIALEGNKLENGTLYLWDMVKPGDVHQLLKFLEAHPVETVSLAATLGTLNLTTNSSVSFSQLRHDVCNSRFNHSDFWRQQNRKHFLVNLCSYDPYQLLSSATSEEFMNFIVGKRIYLHDEKPLQQSVTKFLEALIVANNKADGKLNLKSNIFSTKVWLQLPNDTLQLINEAQKSWIRKLIVAWSPFEHDFVRKFLSDIDMKEFYRIIETHPLGAIRRITKAAEVWIDIISSGDIWQKIRATTIENPKMKILLDLVEDLPNVFISIVDTFLNSERLNEFFTKFLAGHVNACDIDKFIIPSLYIEKRDIISSITNFCQNIVLTQNESLDDGYMHQFFHPLIPSHSLSEENMRNSFISVHEIGERKKIRVSLDESYFTEPLESFRSTLVRVLAEGYKQPTIPNWWISFQEDTLRDFKKQFENRDLRPMAQLVLVKSMKIMKEILLSTPQMKSSCSWCDTRAIEILNSQLTNHQVYSEILCNFNQMNFIQIQEMIDKRLDWKKTLGMIKNYEFLGEKKDINSFVTAVQDTLHYITDIFIDYHQNDEVLKNCITKAANGDKNFAPAVYVKIIIGIIDTLMKNIKILDTSANHEILSDYSQMSEKYIPIWMPLEEVVQKTSFYEVRKRGLNASINVNLLINDRNDSVCVRQKDCSNATILNDFLTSRRGHSLIKYDLKAADYPSTSEISILLAKSLDLEFINREIVSWRANASSSLTWLENILEHLSTILGEGENLLDIASKIDFEDVLKVRGLPDNAEDAVSLVRNQTIDKLFDALENILEDMKPFLSSQKIQHDLEVILKTFRSMEIFENIGLLDMEYAVSEIFNNWNVLRQFLSDDIKLPDEVLTIFDQSKVDMLPVVRKERSALNFIDDLCSDSKNLSEMMNFGGLNTTGDEVHTILCSLDNPTMQNITVSLLRNLNFDYVFELMTSTNVKSILRGADLTEDDGKMIFESFAIVEEILPAIRKKIPLSLFLKLPGDEAALSSDQFLQDASKYMCGRSLIEDNSQFYRIISRLQDNKKVYDPKELNSLPSDFCRDTYKRVLSMPGGKIIWSYVKPLIRGRILYSPKTTVIKKVMNLANQTFIEFGRFARLMVNLEDTLVAIANLSDIGDSLKDLTTIMDTKIMKVAIKSMSEGHFSGEFLGFDLGDVSWMLNRSPKIIEMIAMLNHFLECVLADRMLGFETEEALEEEAQRLTDTNEFLAGIVFMETNNTINREKRMIDSDKLPKDVIYKIRMDVDFVPTTKRTKSQFWLPGPESSFMEDLRYLRGFIQVQDSIDRAIIEVKSGKPHNWKTLSQQMPYPCWKNSPFQSTLYESQGLILCFFFAMMLCVGAAVRFIVWERESRNAMVMSVMGLRPWGNTIAWFITSGIEFTIVAASICIILVVGKILPHSDPVVLMVLLLDYVFSIVTFCYMISTLFSSASLAAITTVVLFLLTYIPYIIVISMQATWQGVMSLGHNLLLCLSMSTSFCYGILYAARREVQGTGLTWDTMWDQTSPHDRMSLGLVLIMIAIDGCLYGLIGYLISRYTNSGRGCHGLRTRSLWWADTRVLYGRPTHLAFVNNLYFTNDVLHPSSTYQDEDSDTSSIIVNEKQVGVRFEGVRKVFNTDRGDVVAVEDFTLKLCEGEVTSLLGRNGAGKTTIIKMLTGMLAPTSGEIHLNGREGTKPNIGVCPQDNVLIGTLTPREHMNFYAKLKESGDQESMEKDVNNMLVSLELGRQEDEQVSRLSGGTKRRLCVALAFLGSPKLVILDEPGAGVDPAARRRIWRLIDQHRINRTILLSTHHLDEADMLSDTVVFMHRGKILCTGSPLTLKKNYGKGYWINVAFPQSLLNRQEMKKNIGNILPLVENVVSNAKTIVDQSSGSEVSINVPFNGKNGAMNDIAAALKVLEDNKKNLTFSRISLECDTLERVFLNLCSKADGRAAMPEMSLTNENSIDVNSDDNMQFTFTESVLTPSPWRQVKALMKKRLWHFTRDWRAPLATLILPTIFVAVAMGFSIVRPPSGDEPPLELTPKLYDQHSTYFYSIDNKSDAFLQRVSLQLHDRFAGDYTGTSKIATNDTGTCECTEGEQVCRGVSKSVEGLLETLPGRPTLDWIVSTFHEYIEKRYGGWSLSHLKKDPLFVVWFNNKGHHSLPAFLNALNEAILRTSGDPGHLTTLNHPLKLSSDQLNRTTILQHVADVGVALVLLVAFSLVAAQGARELVRERVSEEKRILYLAGVHPVTYWTTTLVWDFLVFLCSIGLAIIVFEIFGLPAYIARDNLPGICIILILFAWGAIPFTHLFEKLCDDATVANMVLFCVNTFIGVFCLATILIIDILGESEAAKDSRELIHNIMLFLPQYALGDALIQLSTNIIAADLLARFGMDTYKSPLGWDLLGPHYLCLFIVGVILYSLNLAIECRVLPQWRRKAVTNKNQVFEEDDDVAAERIRVENRTHTDVIKTVNLRKEYRSVHGKNVALKNLSFGVEAGYCFGLLGVNGAGKSTTFKMLTTELRPTSGKIILKDRQVSTRPLCNGEIGYCPQTDALDGFLSPHQCLTIHGEVCGLLDVSRAVELSLRKFDLQKYAHQRVSSLSGGNKRKLCAAISVMAPVSVVLMDEPTSGMDPASKEHVARAVRQVIQSQGCVIMTSHSVAECEKLCSRVGILAKAGLRCIGTVQHLKHKFGEGYVAFLRFSQTMQLREMKSTMMRYFPTAQICSRQATAARFLIPKNEEIALSETFFKLKQLAAELKAADYTLTQSSLDQVLVNFSEELEDDFAESELNLGGRVNLAHSSSSVDAIHMDTF